MTIRLLCAYGVFPANAIITLDAATEAGLIAAKQAEANLAGGVAYEAPPTPPYEGEAQPVTYATAAQFAALPLADRLTKKGGVVLDLSSPYSVLGVVDGAGNLNGGSPWRLLKRVLGYERLIPNFAASAYLANPPATGFPTLPWAASTAYAAGAVRSNGSAAGSANLYVCTVAGTSAASGGPTTTASAITDGTVVWRYLSSDAQAWKANTAYAFGTYVSNVGNLYVCTVAGTSAASGGPTANNTSIADNTVTWCRVQQQWVSSASGNDANSGLSPLLPKATLPLTLVANTHYWVMAGSEFFYSAAYLNANGNAVGCNATRISMTAYKPQTYNECKAQPNPFLRALSGGWVNAAELSEEYYKLYSDGPNRADTEYTGTTGNCFAGGNSSTHIKIRGAYVTGFPRVAFLSQTGGYWDVSDCVVEDISCVQSVGGQAKGFAIRQEGATSSGNHSWKRLFIKGCREDSFWSSATVQANDWEVSDSAIHMAPQNVVNSASHCDVFQFGSFMGAAKIRRVVVEHDLSKVSYSDGGQVVGAAIIGDGSGTAGTSAFEISDSIIVTNRTGTNITPTSSGVGIVRNVFGVVSEIQGPGGGLVQLHQCTSGMALTDCVNVTVDEGGAAVEMYTGNTPTKTRVVELVRGGAS